MKRAMALAAIVGATALAAGLVSQTRAASAQTGATAADIPLLRVGIIGTVSTLDPARAVSGSANQLRALGYDNLMVIGHDGTIKPWLAVSMKHPNPFSYIYTLRKGVKFSSGAEMTAEDVANSLNYYRSPSLQTAAYYGSIRDIKATGRYTILFTLKRRDSSFPYVLTYPFGIFEKKFADAHPDQWGKPGLMPVTTGPWKFVSLDPTRGAELVANDKYWRGRPSIRRISVKFLADETSAAVAFRSGDLDIVPPIDARAFAATSGANVRTAPSCSVGYIGMNVNQAPWNDIHVRRAVAYATNRPGIARAVSGVTVIDQLIPPQMWGGVASKAQVDKLYKSLPKYPFNLTKAKQELARSKYPNGFNATVTAPAGFGPSISITDQVMSASLKQIGINLEVKSVPSGTWLATLYGPRDQLGFMGAGSGCAYPDPSWYPGVFLAGRNARTGSTNIADYKNAKVDALIAAALATSNPAKRLAVYGEMLRVVQRDLPYLFLFVTNANIAVGSKFTWPTFDAWAQSRPWPLELKAK